MSYISDSRHFVDTAPLSSAIGGFSVPSVPASPLTFANARLSEALEATILVATLSGVSLVMSTIAAGAF